MTQSHRLQIVFAAIAALISVGTGNASVTSVRELVQTRASEGQEVIALGFDTAGDGGGGAFRFTENASGSSADGGVVFDARGGGKWVRLDDGPLEAAWFGVHPLRGKPCVVLVDGVPAGRIAFLPSPREKLAVEASVAMPLPAGQSVLRLESLGGEPLTVLSVSLSATELDGSEASRTSGCTSKKKELRLKAANASAEWRLPKSMTAGEHRVRFTYRLNDPTAYRDAKRNTDRLQRALDAATGKTLRLGKGVFPISDTVVIPAGTRVEGRIPHAGLHRSNGTVIEGHGDGVPRRWTDTGDLAKDTFRPVIVFGGDGVELSHTGITPGRSRWEVGVLLPTVSQGVLDNCEVIGFRHAACLMDATWSTRNIKMIRLHGGRVTPANGLHGCRIYCCKLRGGWALMVRGAEGRQRDNRRAGDWVWAPEGTSDLTALASRLQSLGDDGGAYYHNVPGPRGGRAGEAHKLLSCRLHVDSEFIVKLNHSHGFSLAGCYAESRGSSRMANHRSNTTKSEFFGCYFVKETWEDWFAGATASWPVPVNR